jgi:hypothetical protein
VVGVTDWTLRTCGAAMKDGGLPRREQRGEMMRDEGFAQKGMARGNDEGRGVCSKGNGEGK